MSSIKYVITNGKTSILPDNYIVNPFFIEYKSKGILTRDHLSIYKKCFGLCLRKNVKIDKDIIYDIFKQVLEVDNFKVLSKYFILRELSLGILDNKIYYDNAIIINSNDLENFNHCKYDLDKDEIIIPMINFEETDIETYNNLYMSYTIEKIFDMIKIKNKYNYNIPFTIEQITNLFSNKETQYWCNRHDLNFTYYFEKRRFPYIEILTKSNTKCSKEVINIISKLNNLPENNYNLSPVTQQESFIDMFNVLQNSKHRTFYASQNNLIKLDYKDILNLFENYTENPDKLLIIINLLMSKDLCHLIINSDIIKTQQKIFTEHRDIIKYFMGYAWLTLYIEECIFKTSITPHSRYIFTNKTVENLPIYPFSLDNIHQNPYLSIPISSKKLNMEHNMIPIYPIKTTSEYYGIAPINDIMCRLNIFSSYNSELNIFKNLNWSHYALTGSLIPACCQKLPPLMTIKSADKTSRDKVYQYKIVENDWKDYYSKYYSDSDIDLMCSDNSVFGFMDKVCHVIDTIRVNLKDVNLDNNISIEPIKTTLMMIDIDYIKLKINDFRIQLNNPFLELNDILENIDNKIIKQYIYDVYVVTKNKTNLYHQSKHTNKNPLYEYFFNLTPIEHINIYIGSNFMEKDDSTDSEVTFTYGDIMGTTNDKKIIKISENIKFKLTNKYIRPIEIFRIKNNNFISVVSKFHLPCVRAYITYKHNVPCVYGLPSWVTSLMTLMNIDYKYFAGSKDPINIINKYVERGYGVILNTTELTHVILYNSSDMKDQKLNINKLLIETKKNINHCMNEEDVYEFYDSKSPYFKYKTIDCVGNIIPVNKTMLIDYFSKLSIMNKCKGK
jgi:hypothetical protein